MSPERRAYAVAGSPSSAGMLATGVSTTPPTDTVALLHPEPLCMCSRVTSWVPISSIVTLIFLLVLGDDQSTRYQHSRVAGSDCRRTTSGIWRYGSTVKS